MAVKKIVFNMKSYWLPVTFCFVCLYLSLLVSGNLQTPKIICFTAGVACRPQPVLQVAIEGTQLLARALAVARHPEHCLGLRWPLLVRGTRLRR